MIKQITILIFSVFFIGSLISIPIVDLQKQFQPQVYGKKEGLNNPRVLNLISMGNGELLVGTTQFLFHFRNSIFTDVTKTYLNNATPVLAMAKQGDSFWFAQQKEILFYRNGIKKSFKKKDWPGILTHSVNHILPVGNRVYFSSKQGIFYFDGSSFSPLNKGIENLNISSVFYSSQNVLWATTENSIAKLEKDVWTVQNLKQINPFKNLRGNILINGMCEAFGNVWISSLQGLFYQSKGNWNRSTDKTFRFLNPLVYDPSNQAIYTGARDGDLTSYGFYIIRNNNSKLKVSRIRKVEGLADNHITSIVFDEKSIYVGSKSGLTVIDKNYGLFDKTRVPPTTNKTKININLVSQPVPHKQTLPQTRINPLEKKVYSSDAIMNIQSIYEDREKNIWIGTNGKGIYRYDGSQFLKLTTADGLPSDNIYSICEFRGEIYIGTTGGLCVFDGFKIRVLAESEGLKARLIWSLYPENDVLWVGTVNGLFRYDGYLFTHFHKGNTDLPDNWVGSINRNPSGNLWIGTDDGAVSFDGKIFQVFDEFSTGLLNNWVYSIAGFESELWFATPKGVGRFNGRNWTQYTSEFENNPVNQLAVFQGELYAAVEKKGIMKFNGSEFQLISMPQIESTLSPLCFFATDTFLYIGWEKGIVSFFDGKKWLIHDLKRVNQNIGKFVANIGEDQGLPGSIVYDIGIRNISESQKEVWVCTDNGVAVIKDRIVEKIYRKEDGLAFNAVQSVAFYKDQVILGTFSGLSVLEKGSFTNYNTENSGLIADTIWKVKVDPNGKMWIGTVFGLNTFDGKNWETFQRDTNIPFAENWIYDIKLQENGLPVIGIWGGGVVRLDASGWTVFNDNDGSFSEDLVLDDEITSRVVTAIDLSGKSDFFAATYLGGSLYSKGKYTTILKKTKPVLSEFITGVLFEKNNPEIIWMSTDLGLMKWDSKNDRWTLFERGEGVKPYLKVTYIDGEIQEQFEQEGTLPDNYCWSIQEDGDYIWVGTIKGLGLYRKY